MLNLSFTAPVLIDAEVLTQLPHHLRKQTPSSWADANKGGKIIDSFLEGPAYDRLGNLYVTDIPHGRIFRITPSLAWELVLEYDGWPNGIAIHADCSVWIADYRQGILKLDPASGKLETVLGHRNSESFKGINDLTFDSHGSCYFTDQGQTGMHDPSGKVYRLSPDGRLDCLVSNAPSPNGLVVDEIAQALFVAVTRANAIWRGPMQKDGSVSKMAAFQTFFGTSGPDGLALDEQGGVAMAHGSLGGAFLMNARGEVTHYVRSPCGNMVTNLAYIPGTNTLIMAESESGSILRAELPAKGRMLYSHQKP
ncbi:SMP-30/gluconolactonase/LRE family protein [Pusillimonas sp. SM2304]|uniref:SMP-30/gluconolactonase/LRE family protein n=1 Tax=Pusillimonas sp. SM2304 TaxID=3073241 RepID=UPI002873F9C1|nr:SMP-30/gluconolactonase/LRE family protein [Pusillimonas sp. SM2304]MDS1142459.1 SMP-30/gluconolactonase/LRE family protein [Pusillimonas sp. SM2304]